MNIHKNARLTPLGRERLVKLMLSGKIPEAAALAAGVCPRTARKWLARCAARCGASGKRRNAPDGRIWPTEGRFFASAGRRYAPLVVNQTKA